MSIKLLKFLENSKILYKMLTRAECFFSHFLSICFGRNFGRANLCSDENPKPRVYASLQRTVYAEFRKANFRNARTLRIITSIYATSCVINEGVNKIIRGRTTAIIDTIFMNGSRKEILLNLIFSILRKRTILYEKDNHRLADLYLKFLS
jgi:hypothetical protein